LRAIPYSTMAQLSPFKIKDSTPKILERS